MYLSDGAVVFLQPFSCERYQVIDIHHADGFGIVCRTSSPPPQFSFGSIGWLGSLDFTQVISGN